MKLKGDFEPSRFDHIAPNAPYFDVFKRLFKVQLRLKPLTGVKNEKNFLKRGWE